MSIINSPIINSAIIDSTLREGEQFGAANFSASHKVEIARLLDAFGVEYLELTSPCASPQSRKDCQIIAQLGLKTRVLTHIRCLIEDAKVALETGVQGLNVVIGTSSLLRQYSHGKTIDEIVELATTVLTFIRSQNPNIELRFSTEDSFRSAPADLLRVYLSIDQLGLVNRLGLADTVGIATPHQVSQLVQLLRQCTERDLEFHGHNDTGCAVANSYAALEAGATHIDTSVLGIGERNGITPLAGLIARLYTLDPDTIKSKYQLDQLLPLHQYVADILKIPIPFNHCIVGSAAFNHKAGIHTKAMLNHSKTYESIDPDDFKVSRALLVNHKLAGHHVIANRSTQLGLTITDFQIQAITQQIKAIADHQELSLDTIDALLLSTQSTADLG